MQKEAHNDMSLQKQEAGRDRLLRGAFQEFQQAMCKIEKLHVRPRERDNEAAEAEKQRETAVSAMARLGEGLAKS